MSKLAHTGIEPPSRMYTGARPKVASSARAAACVAGWSIGVRLGAPAAEQLDVDVTPGGATSAT